MLCFNKKFKGDEVWNGWSSHSSDLFPNPPCESMESLKRITLKAVLWVIYVITNGSLSDYKFNIQRYAIAALGYPVNKG